MRRAVLGLATAVVLASSAGAQVWRSDQGDGSYVNPPLNADYPDPDIIRVGENFYFASTTFANVPGLTLLTSKDLVNWDILSHLVPKLDDLPLYDLAKGGAYRKGIYAPSLRYRDGVFYVAVTPVDQNTRIYSARDPKGPWTHVELNKEAFDPALFFDDDGSAYLASAVGSDGTITLHMLDRDATRIESSKVIYFNKGAEGSKILKRKGFYYLFNSIPNRLGLTVSRARSLFGPWETRNQIDDTTGGHQGALVDLPNGDYYGFVMLDAGSIGRVTNISPIFWQDDWPVWGTPEAPGRVPARAVKPIQGQPFGEPPSYDDFSGATLGRQWQWNHNPVDRRWSLSERPGYLRLHATTASDLWTARNTLVQKAQGPRARGTVKLDLAGIRPGDVCGFGTFGKYSAQLAVVGGKDGRNSLTMRLVESTNEGPKTDVRAAAVPIRARTLWLRADTDFGKDIGSVGYSLDGKVWRDIGGTFPLEFAWQTGTFQGEQLALSCYNPTMGGGYLDIDRFTLSPLAP
ncbi:MAG: glycoside hydrolase 43 family protein [Sphingobium sp.]|uniref:glycoside hydrolase family 43 protein n=1 Tax=Sphingobium sp. CECT 9361 TaxID=2845384 RepID=UPI001E4CBD0C|nr:glycoside hydrolase 43 family protein [Sphingobium sp. CECT 9361]CAH0352174.1 Beta-xylosidase [Sphingobium sp. CECT 9361]